MIKVIGVKFFTLAQGCHVAAGIPRLCPAVRKHRVGYRRQHHRQALTRPCPPQCRKTRQHPATCWTQTWPCNPLLSRGRQKQSARPCVPLQPLSQRRKVDQHSPCTLQKEEPISDLSMCRISISNCIHSSAQVDVSATGHFRYPTSPIPVKAKHDVAPVAKAASQGRVFSAKSSAVDFTPACTSSALSWCA